MKKITQMLEESIFQEEVLRTARAQRVLRRWKEVVGDGLAQRSIPDRFERGTVWVAVSGSAWAQELRMLKTQILYKLNLFADEKDLFKDIRFGVRKLQTPEAEENEQSKTTGEPDPRSEMSIREILERRLRIMNGED